MTLPPNITSVVQPMDQGIICNFKKKFKDIYSQVLIENESWDILKVCFAIEKAWSRVTPQTIANTFRHSGFVQTLPEVEIEVVDEDDLPLAELIRRLHCTQEEAEAFYTADDHLLTSAPPGIDGIAEAFLPSDSDSDEEPSESEPSPRKISRKELSEFIHGLKVFACSQDKPYPTLFAKIRLVEDEIDEVLSASKKQKCITDFFK